MEKKIELEERLITFAVSILDVSESLPRNLVSDQVVEQLLKRGINPLFSYPAAQHSSSREEFIERLQVTADTLRGTSNLLKVIKQKNWVDSDLSSVLEQNNHLIAIFAKSLVTTKKNNIP